MYVLISILLIALALLIGGAGIIYVQHIKSTDASVLTKLRRTMYVTAYTNIIVSFLVFGLVGMVYYSSN